MVFPKNFRRKKHGGIGRKRKAGSSYQRYIHDMAASSETQHNGDVPPAVPHELPPTSASVPHARPQRSDDNWQTARAVKSMQKKLDKEKSRSNQISVQNDMLKQKAKDAHNEAKRAA